MSAVHQDLLKAGQGAAASATAVREPLDLGSTFKSKTRQELRKMADAALHGQGESISAHPSAAQAACGTAFGHTAQGRRRTTSVLLHCTLQQP